MNISNETSISSKSKAGGIALELEPSDILFTAQAIHSYTRRPTSNGFGTRTTRRTDKIFRLGLWVCCFLIFWLRFQVSAVEIANSTTGFSGTQGKNGWYYGYSLATNNYNPATDFTQLPLFGVDAGGGQGWYFSLASWVMMRPYVQHPNKLGRTGQPDTVERWAIRRWVSNTFGAIRISGTIEGASGGDGADFLIVVDGVPVYSTLVRSLDKTAYSLEVSIYMVSTVDFIMKPRANDQFDTTYLYSNIDLLAAADLTVQGAPTITPNATTAGSTVTIAYTILNQGGANAGASQTKVQIKNSSGTQVMAPTFAAPAISAGASATVSHQITLADNLASGTYTFYVILDNLSQLSQSNTANDLTSGAVASVTQALLQQSDVLFTDLVSLTPLQTQGNGTLTVVYKIRNSGNRDAGISQTKIQIKDSSGGQVHFATFSEAVVPQGQTVSRSGSVTLPSLNQGNFTLYVILDNQIQLNQSNVANDYSAGVSFKVVAAPSQQKSDLAFAGAITVNPDAIVPGNDLFVTYSIVNRGDALANPSETKIAILNGSRQIIREKWINEGSLEVGTQRTNTVAIAIPIEFAGGSYLIKLYLDNQNALGQSNVLNDYSPIVSFSVNAPQPQPVLMPSDQVLGIDISHNQPQFSQTTWNQFRNVNGIQFAYIKGTQATKSLRSNNYEPSNGHVAYFLQQAQRAQSAGVKVGAYHFAEPPNTNPIEAANDFVDAVGAFIKSGNLPPALDIEDAEQGGEVYSAPSSMTDESLALWVIQWAEEVKRLTHVTPVLYMNASFASAHITAEVKRAYGLWVADWDWNAVGLSNYTPSLMPIDRQPSRAGWSDWTLHQYYGVGTQAQVTDPKLSQVRLAGMTIPIDLNMLHGNLESFVIPMPQVATHGRFQISGNSVSIEVAGRGDEIITIQASNDLVNWVDASVLQLSNGVGEFVEKVIQGTKSRFYRVKP